MGNAVRVNEPSDPSAARREIAIGAVAGAIGGLAGAAVKLGCEKIAPPRTPDREPPPGVIAANIVRAVSGRELSHERMATVALAIHWTFSTLTSAMYGALAARAKPARAGGGVAFGIAVWVGFHEITLPLLRATPPLRELPIGEQINEAISHAIFGVTVERVRSLVVGIA